MFGKMMNSYFYGKSGKGDFTPDDLPKNRWELFWSMLRVRLSALTRLNLMTLIAFLPLFILVLWFSLSLLDNVNNAFVYEDALRTGAELEPTVFTEEVLSQYEKYTQDGVFQVYQYTRYIFQVYLSFFCLLLIPVIMITGPVEAGLAYVCRNWARDEHAFIWSDFKDAVKENWKQGLGISVITSVLPIIIYVAWNFYSQMTEQSIIYMVPQVLVLMLGFVWTLGLVFFYPLMVSYKMTFPQVVKNGLLLSVARLPQTVGIRLVMLIPILIVVALLFTNIGMYAVLVVGGYYLILGFALERFVFASFTNAVFDRYINSKIEGAQVNRGLASEDDLDDEVEDVESGEDSPFSKPEN